MLASEQAPAKLNLALHVLGRRPDGYHALDSLVVFAEIADELSIRPARRDGLSLGGPFASGLGAGPGNLVLRALAAFREDWPDALPPGLAISLDKNLPVAAGIGGGSADAAATLRLLARIADPTPPEAVLAAMALKLGADVPVCLLGRPARIGGIGEVLEPLPQFPACHAVLVNPLVPLVTADVFRRLERHDNPGLPELPEPLSHASLLALWLEETRNDLEPPAIALVPEIGRLIASVRAQPGAMLARMSGSGATVFGLFGSAALAHQAAHELRRLHPQCWVAAGEVGRP